ncbi:50S ribosomal protein L29 [Candidatus Woesearchaeota archaeon]|nr:50S ribosomal protein L29 [Candidatus Woesearchaeota archaeon]
MKYAELTKKSPEELAKLADQFRVDLMKYQAQAATGAPGKESGKIRAIKRDIARVKMAQGGASKQ